MAKQLSFAVTKSAEPTRGDDEDILHAMRFLGTDNPQHAIKWLAEQDREWLTELGANFECDGHDQKLKREIDGIVVRALTKPAA